jgi:hypothetical protein
VPCHPFLRFGTYLSRRGGAGSGALGWSVKGVKKALQTRMNKRKMVAQLKHRKQRKKLKEKKRALRGA